MPGFLSGQVLPADDMPGPTSSWGSTVGFWRSTGKNYSDGIYARPSGNGIFSHSY